MNAFLKSIPQTLYSGPFYVNLILRGKGIGWKYIFLQTVLIFAFFVSSVFWGQASISTFQSDIDSFFAQMPGVSVKDNQLVIDKPSPAAVKLSNDKGDYFVVFDTTPREKNDAQLIEEMQAKKIIILFANDFIATLQEEPNAKPSIEYSSYAKYNNLKISHEEFVEMGKGVLPTVGTFGFMALFFFTLVGNFIKALLIKISALFFSVKPGLGDSMRLAAAASIPVGLLRIALVPFHLPISPLFGMLITLAFAVFGLTYADREAKAKDLK